MMFSPAAIRLPDVSHSGVVFALLFSAPAILVSEEFLELGFSAFDSPAWDLRLMHLVDGNGGVLVYPSIRQSSDCCLFCCEGVDSFQQISVPLALLLSHQ